MDAIKWLVDEKKIKAIGTDATSLENFNHKNADGIDDQPNHNYVFEHNVAMVESLTNLDKEHLLQLSRLKSMVLRLARLELWHSLMEHLFQNKEGLTVL